MTNLKLLHFYITSSLGQGSAESPAVEGGEGGRKRQQQQQQQRGKQSAPGIDGAAGGAAEATAGQRPPRSRQQQQRERDTPLEGHRQGQRQEKQAVCGICLTAFSSEAAARQHAAAVHGGF